MKIPVHMLAFGNGAIRLVDVPDTELTSSSLRMILERVFYWGQNDFQPLPFPSVSIGDVVEYDGTFHQVGNIGFTVLTTEEFEDAKRENSDVHKREFPSRCFSCGKIAVSPKKIEYDACVKSGGQLHDFHIKDLEVFECEECHEQGFGAAADHQITSGLRLHLTVCTGCPESGK